MHLGIYHTCVVIGINPKHESRISSNIPCLYGDIGILFCNGLGTKISFLAQNGYFCFYLCFHHVSYHYHHYDINYLQRVQLTQLTWSISFIVKVWETVATPNFFCLSVCLCVCLAFTAYISIIMSQFLMKLGGNFEI